MRPMVSVAQQPISFCSCAGAQSPRPKYSTPSPPPDRPCTTPDVHTPDSKPKTVRFRLSQLCRRGQIHLARQVFDAIPQPSAVLWNTIIIGYICNGMPYEAISLYSFMYSSIMGSQDPKGDAYTYSSILKACARTREILVGKAIHCHVLRSSVYSSRIVRNSLLNMYAACLMSTLSDGGCDLVERVFKTMRKRNAVSWNTMISWYTKRDRFLEAVRHLMLMMNMGLKPTAVSFVNVFPAVSRLRYFRIANVLYGMIMKLGDGYANDLFVVSSAITMYAELGYPDISRKIFDNCFEKNAHVWNTMIGGYVQNNCPVIALELFFKALEDHDAGNTDEVTFLLALTAVSELQHLGVARQLHAYLIKRSLVSSVILLNGVTAMYSKCSSIGDSFKVFGEMLERDVVSWNTIICALVQDGMNEEGLMLVYEMQKQGFSIDDVTVTALLSAASNLRNQELGKQTHAYLIRHDIQLVGVDSYLIDMYSKSGLLQSAKTIFSKSCQVNGDLAVWNAMISGCTQNGFVKRSIEIFQQMLEENVMPNAVTLASILPACSQMGNITLGKLLHSFSVRNLLDKNVFVSSALVDMYSKSGAVVYAERVFAKSVEKNSVTFTNMILGYAQHGMSEKAIMLFHSMREFGVNPDAVTFVAVLSACCYTGSFNEGLEIFESMGSYYGIRPTGEHYACLVDMLGRVGRLVEAYEFAQRLGEDGNAFGIWGSLLAACKIHNNFELGKAVADKLLKMEGADRIAGYHVLISNMYAEEGNWEYVNALRKEMLQKGLTKEVGCSWIDICGNFNSFASKDRKHPQCNEIHQLLKHLSANLKDADYMPPFVLSEF